MRTKRKIDSHLIEKQSLSIIERLLPKYWTIRDLKPDYGLDLNIELFEEKVNKDKTVYDTLGEHIFVQVKGVEKIEKKTINVKERNNIENEPLKESSKNKEIEVVKFCIDTIELRTVQRMGNAVPVLLFLVDISEEKIYFICLNDYIDKILLPSESTYFQKKTKVLNIPVRNEISKNKDSLYPLYLYAKRPKYYAFFNKVGYQDNELNYCNESSLKNQCSHFAEILLHYDIWSNESNWHALSYFHQNLISIINSGAPELDLKDDVELNDKDKEWENGHCQPDEYYTQKDMFIHMRIRSFWQQMDNLKNVFESMCREWFLPTYLSEIMHK